MKIELADIATNERKKLDGFKVLGVFPFYLRYITTRTHIQLCKIKEELKNVEAVKGHAPEVYDFYNAKLQEQVTPLINKYVLTGLLNNRAFSFLLKPFLYRKIKQCSHKHILSLFATITKLGEPAFFLSYWNALMIEDHTLLKGQKQS